MKTATEQGAGSSTRHMDRVRDWIGVTAMIALAFGVSGCCRIIPGLCRETMDTAALKVGGCTTPSCGLATSSAALIEPSDCPTGQCDPDPNGLGIYVGEGGNYCNTGTLAGTRLCPETIVSESTGVTLRLRDRQAKNGIVKASIPRGALETDDPNATATNVTIAGIRSDRTELAVDYIVQGEQTKRTAKGAELGKLRLWVERTALANTGPLVGSLTFRGWMKLIPRSTNAGGDGGDFRRYELSFEEAPGKWTPHCAAGAKVPGAVFIPGKAVDGMNAAVTTEPSAITVACDSGAIVACLAWGYTPWDPATGKGDANRDFVFGSCLQAKRAAYFAGRGDLKGYTTTGTPLLKRDQFGFGNKQQLDTEAVEALWSPRGAECLNLQHRRHPEIPIADTHGVPPCPKPTDWLPDAKLATSVDKP